MPGSMCSIGDSGKFGESIFRILDISQQRFPKLLHLLEDAVYFAKARGFKVLSQHLDIIAKYPGILEDIGHQPPFCTNHHPELLHCRTIAEVRRHHTGRIYGIEDIHGVDHIRMQIFRKQTEVHLLAIVDNN